MLTIIISLVITFFTLFFSSFQHCITMTSQWVGWRLKSPGSRLFTQPFIRAQIKGNIKARVTGLCAWNSPGTGEFPAQMASNAENVSIWWRHHGKTYQKTSDIPTSWATPYKKHVSPFCHCVCWWSSTVRYSGIGTGNYRQFSNITRTQSPNINVSRLDLQLSLPNPLKPRVKLITQM